LGNVELGGFVIHDESGDSSSCCSSSSEEQSSDEEAVLDVLSSLVLRTTTQEEEEEEEEGDYIQIAGVGELLPDCSLSLCVILVPTVSCSPLG